MWRGGGERRWGRDGGEERAERIGRKDWREARVSGSEAGNWFLTPTTINCVRHIRARGGGRAERKWGGGDVWVGIRRKGR